MAICCVQAVIRAMYSHTRTAHTQHKISFNGSNEQPALSVIVCSFNTVPTEEAGGAIRNHSKSYSYTMYVEMIGSCIFLSVTHTQVVCLLFGVAPYLFTYLINSWLQKFRCNQRGGRRFALGYVSVKGSFRYIVCSFASRLCC